MKLPAWQKKLPRKVTLCGRTYEIIYNMQRGACGDFDTQKITIGCSCSKEVTLDYLVHEISEIIHTQLGYTFGYGREERYVMVHAQFQNHNMLLVAALLDCGLLK